MKGPGSIPVGFARRKLAFAYRPKRVRDVFSPDQLRQLALLCDICDVAPLESFEDSRAADILSDVEILVTGWGCPRIDRAVLKFAPRLQMIPHAAGTVKFFVAPEVSEAGIVVTNAASANAIPVAEFSLAAILFANKKVLGFAELYRSRREATHPEHLTEGAVGNWHKTVGIDGVPRIGRRVIELLKPFDLTVLAHDPYLDATEAGALGVEKLALDAMIARSDVLTLHAPALEATRHMIDARRLALMKDGAALIDHAAQERELVSGRISAVIDVTEPEVQPASSPLYTLPNVLLTPHIAGAVGNERQRLGSLALGEVERFVKGLPLEHAVVASTLHFQA